MSTSSPLSSRTEIEQFNALSAQWWQADGPMRPLHAINPTRLSYIASHVDLNGKKVLDVGCGGGLLSEGLAKEGATVTAIDMAENLIHVAREHAKVSQLNIDYHAIDAKAFANKNPGQFEIITCLEMIEHVEDPAALLHTLSQLCKPGGHIFLSTLNRHPKAFLKAIVGAEYIFNLLPRGTHHYEKFIKPSSLKHMASQAKIDLNDFKGLDYHPFSHRCELSDDLSVNYIAHGNTTQVT